MRPTRPPSRAPQAVTLAALLALPGLARAEARDWRVDPGSSHLSVHVYKAGAFSSALHDHYFIPGEVAGKLSLDPARPEAAKVELTVGAGSLRDHQPKLSAKDEAKVNAQAKGPEVLDADHHPTITFAADRLEKVDRKPASGGGEVVTGELVGTLNVRGVSRPMRVPVRATITSGAVRAEGKATFKQSDFGIKPLHKALGAIGVKDELDVDFDVQARPGGAP